MKGEQDMVMAYHIIQNYHKIQNIQPGIINLWN